MFRKLFSAIILGVRNFRVFEIFRTFTVHCSRHVPVARQVYFFEARNSSQAGTFFSHDIRTIPSEVSAAFKTIKSHLRFFSFSLFSDLSTKATLKKTSKKNGKKQQRQQNFKGLNGP